MSLCTCKNCGCYFANLETAACPACYRSIADYAGLLAALLGKVRAAYRGHPTYRNTVEIVADIDAALAKNPVMGGEAEKAGGARAPEDANSAATPSAEGPAEVPGSGPAPSHDGTRNGEFPVGVYPAGGRWMIVYDDTEVAPESFTDEAAARRRLAQAQANWNCHLYARVATTARNTIEPGAFLQSFHVPEGWKLVPVEPTEPMLVRAVETVHGPATYRCVTNEGTAVMEEDQLNAYKAMLDAAPEPPAGNAIGKVEADRG